MAKDTIGKRPILIVQTAFLGDVILSIPLLLRIKKNFIDSPIHYVCRKGLGNFLQELGVIDRYFEIEKGDRQSYRTIRQTLLNFDYEIIFCPHESVRSALLVYGLRSKSKIGFRTWWNSIFFQWRIAKNLRLPEALRQMSLLGALDEDLEKKLKAYAGNFAMGEMGDVPDWASLSLPNQISRFSNSKSSTYKLSADANQPFVCLFPGSVWATKQWTKEGYAQVAKEFLALKYSVILLGGAGEEELGSYIEQREKGVMNLIHRTSLQETLKIMLGAKCVITNDSAGQHLAALCGVPTVSIFGPTVLEFGFRPWNPKSIIVENKDLKCRPCGPHGHMLCPLSTHECMKSVSAKAVMAAAELLIQRH